ncbi:porin family protein [Hymenobacter properus]|uniref:PorT family protein n=1 Tax=Hymenobacter properus TaxID=2791026 RepID=A0A931FJ58_9BACT|nr:porin family protein [Hymenobacter properus]MBF9140160.1 PorT family protein [Hymenobacter properus]MBR7718967.1 PorT family protein [Microvirga sp. SRT04]
MQLTFTTAFLSVALLTSGQALGQDLGLGVHIGPKAGVALSVLDGQLNRSTFYKAGFSGGLMLRIRREKAIAIQPELLFVQQGTGSGLKPNSSSADYKINFNSINLPVMVKVYLGKMVNLQVGPQVGCIVSAREVGQIGTSSSGAAVSTDRDVLADYYPLNFAVCGGLGIDLPNGLVASARLNYGFSDINNNPDDQKLREALKLGGLHNRGFEFSVGYLLGVGKQQ